MSQRPSYTQSSIADFVRADASSLLGELAGAHGFELDILQRNAWISRIALLKAALSSDQVGYVLLEFVIPRVGKRGDAIVVWPNAIVVIECGSAWDPGADRRDNTLN